jgi:hypothetical protein
VTRSLCARTSPDRGISTSSTTTRQCKETKLIYGRERQGIFLLWKNKADGKRHGDDTNHMTPRLRLHWLAHAVFGSDGVWDGITLVSLQESVITTPCLKSSCEDPGRLAICTEDICVYSFWHSKHPHSSSAGSRLLAHWVSAPRSPHMH